RTLRQQPGVLRVDRVGARYEMSSQPDYLNDPYFDGHNTQPPGQPAGPLFASPTYPGQWDMHIIGMENVFGYRNSGNSVPANPGALGSASVRLAIIDTGADVSLTDIGPANSPRIVRTQCFITPSGGVQSHTQNVSDFDGHGTNVTGIAAANTNNGFGFVGSGGNVSLMIYRIFPSGANSSASSADEVAAINDAIQNGANIISLSLGSSQQDPSEGAAIANAIQNKVTVVAAAGNEKATALDFPAGYPGVIAVGASAIDDKGTERVASYSNYVPGSTTWGLIAPGGDPTLPAANDSDFLHWIENAYSLRAEQPCRAASGGTDFFGESGNCNVLIAGTSQATPHVAGAVAMLFSVKGVMDPASVKQALLASTHDITDPKQGAGRLNEYRLIATALNDPNPPPK
ncbi:MAG: S8 family serine peptidase, partial [Candidatus Eremiobacteraeota bacterium]|nr:S8 family serine peptidase [Candidatus Eremiobacteraeota bacterium]